MVIARRGQPFVDPSPTLGSTSSLHTPKQMPAGPTPAQARETGSRRASDPFQEPDYLITAVLLAANESWTSRRCVGSGFACLNELGKGVIRGMISGKLFRTQALITGTSSYRGVTEGKHAGIRAVLARD